MSIREYSMTRDSTWQLSPGFKVREFACKGSDAVRIDDEWWCCCSASGSTSASRRPGVKRELAKRVAEGEITPEQYKEITGEDYDG